MHKPGISLSDILSKFSEALEKKASDVDTNSPGPEEQGAKETPAPTPTPVEKTKEQAEAGEKTAADALKDIAKEAAAKEQEAITKEASEFGKLFAQGFLESMQKAAGETVQSGAPVDIVSPGPEEQGAKETPAPAVTPVDKEKEQAEAGEKTAQETMEALAQIFDESYGMTIQKLASDAAYLAAQGALNGGGNPMGNPAAMDPAAMDPAAMAPGMGGEQLPSREEVLMALQDAVKRAYDAVSMLIASEGGEVE